MRRLVIAVVGISLGMAGLAHAQGTFGGPKKQGGTGTFGGPNGTAPRTGPASTWGVAPPEPYERRAPPAYPNSSGSTGSTDGGEGFKPYKPFKGGSIYENKKPAKPIF